MIKLEVKNEDEIITNNKVTEELHNKEQISSLSDLESLALKTRSGRRIKFNSDYMQNNAIKKHRQSLMNQVKKVLSKNLSDRSKEETDLLTNCNDLVQHVDLNNRNRLNALQHQEIVVDDQKTLEVKCKELAQAIIDAKSCVVYTGAGISTSCSIPDYRGPNGLWTMMSKGIKIEMPDFSLVDPSFSHMALSSMMKAGLIDYIVSQNCDGLHLRSGIDSQKLSELHGNCFIEFCMNPDCYAEYIRDFDVTERTSFRNHATGRYCTTCQQERENFSTNGNDKVKSKVSNQLRDSIIHFGEKLRNGSPYNWELARDAVKNADLIICLGTSLKVLKHYACLWPKKKSTLIYIVNIQWTPKDKLAKLKINGYCDQVLELVVSYLQENYKKSFKVTNYVLKQDPLLKMYTRLTNDESKTTSKSLLTSRLTSNSKTNLKRELSTSSSVNTTSSDETKEEANTVNTNSWYNRSFKAKKSVKITTSSTSSLIVQSSTSATFEKKESCSISFR